MVRGRHHHAKAVRTGVVGGIGAEYTLGSNWSVKAKYDYIKLGQQSFTGNGVQVTALLIPKIWRR